MADITDSGTAFGYQRLSAWAAAAPSVRKAAWLSSATYLPGPGNAGGGVRAWPLRSPVVQWIRHLMEGVSGATLACPRCGRREEALPALDHALSDHQLGFTEAAAWLEQADADLFSLAIHYLMVKGRRPEHSTASN
jgi:hypothetical protein